jgi:hypothetical protein
VPITQSAGPNPANSEVPEASANFCLQRHGHAKPVGGTAFNRRLVDLDQLIGLQAVGHIALHIEFAPKHSPQCLGHVTRITNFVERRIRRTVSTPWLHTFAIIKIDGAFERPADESDAVGLGVHPVWGLVHPSVSNDDMTHVLASRVRLLNMGRSLEAPLVWHRSERRHEDRGFCDRQLGRKGRHDRQERARQGRRERSRQWGRGIRQAPPAQLHPVLALFLRFCLADLFSEVPF